MAKKKAVPEVAATNVSVDSAVATPAVVGPEAPAAAPKEKVEKPKIVRVEQNGITRPLDGTKTARVWEIADSLSAAAGKPAERKDVLAAGVAESLNPATITTQHGRWREFHGLVNKRAAATAAEPIVPNPQAPVVATTVSPVEVG